VNHVRKFDRSKDDLEDAEITVGVFGFWRLMLEQATGFYIWLMSGLGLFLVFCLAVLSFPIRLVIGSISLMMASRHFTQVDYVYPDQIDPALATPVPANDNKEDDKEVVRRVVYEEAKVSKGASK
jgi:hypothetical protein